MRNQAKHTLSLALALLFLSQTGVSGKTCGKSSDNGCAGADWCFNAEDVGNWQYGRDTDSCQWCDEDDDCSGSCLLIGICESSDGEVFVNGALCTDACTVCVSAGENENYFLCGCDGSIIEEEEECVRRKLGGNEGDTDQGNRELGVPGPSDPCARNRRLESLTCPEGYTCYAQPQLGGFCLDDKKEPCISSHTTLHVLGKGLTNAEDLKIGDQIMIDDEQYEEVFMFGHANAYAMGEFYRIDTDGNTDGGALLEISGEHLIYKGGFIDPVPAADVSTHDVVSDGAKIMQIERLHRQGLYSPLVKGGVFQAGGVKISSYTSVSDSGIHAPHLNVGNVFQFSFHKLQHMAIAPFRLLNSLGFTFDERNYEGQLLFISGGEELVHQLMEYGVVGQLLASVSFGVAMGPIYVLESAGIAFLTSIVLCLVCIYTLSVVKK